MRAHGHVAAPVLVLAAALVFVLVAPAAQAKRPQRLVAVGPAVTEIVLALGLEDALVGVDESSRPLLSEPAKARVQNLGYQRLLSTEGVAGIRPDLVLYAPEAGPPSTLDQLRTAGLTLEPMPSPVDAAGTRALIRKLATRLDRGEAGARIIAELDASLAAVAKRTRGIDRRPRVLCLVARGGGVIIGAGGDTAVAELIRLAGGDNVLEAQRSFKPVGPEALLAARPEVVLLPESARPLLDPASAQSPLASLFALPADRRPKLVTLPDARFFGLGPGMGAAAGELADALHGGVQR